MVQNKGSFWVELNANSGDACSQAWKGLGQSEPRKRRRGVRKQESVLSSLHSCWQVCRRGCGVCFFVHEHKAADGGGTS